MLCHTTSGLHTFCWHCPLSEQSMCFLGLTSALSEMMPALASYTGLDLSIFIVLQACPTVAVTIMAYSLPKTLAGVLICLSEMHFL